ncbi:MAG: carboxypeptidase-like regulatory domain-containing protein [Tannerellaceae bacterium]|nr:carboxypeptidase-like regulatory domain-containing protein [Tannerellaceae bacterium]
MKTPACLYALWILLFVFPAYAVSARTITGTVIDDYADPVIGANVLVKGTTNGTITDIDGHFTLTIEDDISNPVLQISYIGFIMQEVPVSGQSEYLIRLFGDNQRLDEVVVVGYGTVRRGDIAGSMSTVSAAKGKEKTATTWKRSGTRDNSIRLEIGEGEYLSPQGVQLAVRVDGFRVRVLMDCFFYNDKGNGLEGVFKLKLPAEASPYYFAFGETEYLDEEEEDKKKARLLPFADYSLEEFSLHYGDIEEQEGRDWDDIRAAQIVSRQKAAKAYEQTVSANIDPALMEFGGADMFSCRVFPLQNHTLHRIVVGYDLYMNEALDFREYILQLPQTKCEIKVDLLIQEAPDLQASVSPKIEPVESEKGYTHYSLVNPKKKDYTVRYRNVDPVMLVQPADGTEKLDIPYFASTYRVTLPEIPEENLPTDAVFLLDVSLSSSPDKFNVWLLLMEEILKKNRDIIKRYAVVTFNVETHWYKTYFESNNAYNIEQLKNYVNTLGLEGATDLASALQEASSPYWLKKEAQQPKHLFLLSDADCNWGETNMHKFGLLLQPGDRVHTYKTGLSGTNVGILNYLSSVSGGFAFTVTGEEELALTARSFRYKPWTIEKIEVKGTEDFLIAGQPAQLYNGQKLIFTGREIPEGTIRIDLNNGVEKRTIEYKAKHTLTSSLVSRMYGQVATGYLENYGLQAEEAAVNYATYYWVPGRYTSLLMLENDWDYKEFVVDEYEAREFVMDYEVTELVEAFMSSPATHLLGNPKAEFISWLERLDNEMDIAFMKGYLEGLPEHAFEVPIRPREYRIRQADQQTVSEKELLADEDIRYDNLYPLAKRRAVAGKPDALKLLSSVIERNASDIQAIRDVAMAAIDWGLPEYGYYMMRRIIEWREGEGLAYLTAAEALAAAGRIDMALLYYSVCVGTDWNRDYGSLRTLAALKCLRYVVELSVPDKYLITDATRAYMEVLRKKALDILESDGLEEAEEADIVVMINWNVGNTDIDLHVIEPSGEECYYNHRNTASGGQMTIDVTNGYGPEMYLLREAPAGKYAIRLVYYGDAGTRTASKPKVYVDVYRNWGRPTEKLTRKVIQLDKISHREQHVMSFLVK